jgi:hypothetical protein
VFDVSVNKPPCAHRVVAERRMTRPPYCALWRICHRPHPLDATVLQQQLQDERRSAETLGVAACMMQVMMMCYCMREQTRMDTEV